MADSLFPDSEVFQKKRPTKMTDIQVKEFFLKMAQEVIDNGWSRSDLEDIAPDLKRLNLSDSGFEMAKYLETYGYNGDYHIDASFVEWLEDLDSEYSQVIEENVKAWVKAHNIQPKLQVGQKVKLNEGIKRCFEPGQEVYVTAIYKDSACYVLHPMANYKGGWIIAYERIESQIVDEVGKEATNA